MKTDFINFRTIFSEIKLFSTLVRLVEVVEWLKTFNGTIGTIDEHKENDERSVSREEEAQYVKLNVKCYKLYVR